MTAMLATDDRGTGRDVVLVHGLTFSRGTWDPIAELLAQRHRVVTVDLPGHGESEGSAADPVAVAARLHETLDTLGVRRPVVVGHSAGAMMATGYAANYPVAGVMNVDQPLLMVGFAGFLQQVAEGLRGPDFPTAFAPFEASIGVDQLAEPERTRVAGTRSIRQEVVLDHWSLPLSSPPAQLQAVVDQMLDAIAVPYLYLTGGRLPAEVQDHLQTHLRQLEVVVWPQGGHLLHLAEPAAFADLVGEFAATCA